MKVINRIKSNEEFAATVKKGKVKKAPSYIVHYRKNELNVCRIGLSVSKKIANAVTRNRIKRQIRAMCDSLINYNDHAFDIVVVVRKEFTNNDFEKNKTTLNIILSEIGITK